MNEDQLRNTVIEALRGIAPEADYDALADDEDVREYLDIDSMDFLNFVIALHQKTGVDVPERDYTKLRTVARAVAYLARAG